MRLQTQVTLEETNAEYAAFVEKFKPKKTTDDCYTPETVYNVIRDWACEKYGFTPEAVVRPFWPGGDYERYDYPEGCVVLDNPPFSIISKIVNNYVDSGIRFFLFCPYLTCIGLRRCTKVICDANIEYENGAIVNTCFVTNMEKGIVARSEPKLRGLIKDEVERLNKEKKKELPKYTYPDEVITASDFGYMSAHGVEFAVKEEDCEFIRAMDAQREAGKAIFGSGLLLSERAAAERAAAERAAAERAAAERAAAERAAATKWILSEREKEIIKRLGNR